MPWGKFRGQLIEDVPITYLFWAINQDFLDVELAGAITEELAERGWVCNGGDVTANTGTSGVSVASKLKSWYREMAMKFHPDRTLDDGKIMSAINAGYERLQELFGVAK